jgi:hypothetical protein
MSVITLYDKVIINVIDYIQSKEDFSFLLLGNSGLGKSMFTKKYFLTKIENDKNFLFIYIDLKEIHSVENINTLIYNALALYKIKLLSNEIDYILKNKNLFFILDSFDEIGCRSDFIEAEESFKKIFFLKKLGYNFILTSRTQYFKSIQTIKQISKIENLEILTLTPWSKEQIFEFIEKNINNAQEIYDMIFSIYNLKDLCSTPLLLSMVLESISYIDIKKEFTSSELYTIYIKNWLEREDSNLILPWFEKEEFISYLAWNMYVHSISKVHFKELENKLIIQYKPNLTEKNYISNSIRSRSFLVRDDDGYYFFQHRSFMEFIVAEVMINALRRHNLEVFGLKLTFPTLN